MDEAKRLSDWTSWRAGQTPLGRDMAEWWLMRAPDVWADCLAFAAKYDAKADEAAGMLYSIDCSQTGGRLAAEDAVEHFGASNVWMFDFDRRVVVRSSARGAGFIAFKHKGRDYLATPFEGYTPPDECRMDCILAAEHEFKRAYAAATKAGIGWVDVPAEPSSMEQAWDLFEASEQVTTLPQLAAIEAIRDDLPELAAALDAVRAEVAELRAQFAKPMVMCDPAAVPVDLRPGEVLSMERCGEAVLVTHQTDAPAAPEKAAVARPAPSPFSILATMDHRLGRFGPSVE